MFKIESYITPILLSYVDKYIKNFRPEDSQVSLWGGDVCFHNLDLRLDVLEEELQLPFSIISGHIHELLIHVPWTKLASEPIKITINTIECSLTLRDSENVTDSANVQKEKKRKQSSTRKQDAPAVPPGYIQSLINKIVNNITIQCNNLIFKYVEEDIVVSINIKLLTFQSADDNWNPAFTDVSPTQMIIRKLITLSDLTICLDKRNAAGKIEVYQEPILYRCSVEIRVIRHFLTNKSDKAINTRLDIYCNRMEFSMTDQQIPMIMRLINLLIALQQRQLKTESTSDVHAPSSSTDEEEIYGGVGNWSDWAWSVASAIFPTESDENKEWQNMQQQNYFGNTLQCGIYIDHTSVTFRFSEYLSYEKGYYGTRKLKYYPFLCLQLNGFYIDMIIGGAEWTSIQMGISEILLLPLGNCSCGIVDLFDKLDVPVYFKSGFFNETYKSHSLFDVQDEKINTRKNFIVSWDYYLTTVTEIDLLNKTPAFAIDFLYHLELPEDFTSEKMSELGSDLEYSNLNERSICRIIIGPFNAHICSGLIHRVSTLIEVTKIYDYTPYKDPPSQPELYELLPPSEDDYDALNAFIPLRIYQVTFFKPAFEFQLMDHSKFTPDKENMFRKRSKSTDILSLPIIFSQCPSLSFECETWDTKIVMPMYPKRLIYTCCQLPDPPENMLNASYQHIDIKVSGFNSQIIFNKNKRTTIVLPFNVNCVYKSIIFPKYWVNSDVVNEDIILNIDNITLIATKAKLLVIYHILEKLILLDIADSKNTIFSSSLLYDAAKDFDVIILELYGEIINWHKIQTSCTITHSISLNTFKTFLLESGEISQENKPNLGEFNQMLIISGPECNNAGTSTQSQNEDELCKVIIQYPRNFGNHDYPTLLYFNLKEMKMCFDPSLFQWLLYTPKYYFIKQERIKSSTETVLYKSRVLSDPETSIHDTPRRANTPHESIHSSSEKDVHHSVEKTSSIIEEIKENETDTYYNFFLRWYQLFSNVVVFGNVAECTTYFPTKPLSAIGSGGIEELIKSSLDQIPQLRVMVINLPNLTLHTVGQKHLIANYFSTLPVKLPKHIWSSNKLSFPWNIEIKRFCCFTLYGSEKLYFLNPVSGNITISLSLKYKVKKDPTIFKTLSKSLEKSLVKKDTKKVKNKKESFQEIKAATSLDEISSFSFCIYIDNTPILVALSEIQVLLISNILNAISEVVKKFTSIADENRKFKEESSTNVQKSKCYSPTYLKEEHFDTFSEKTPSSVLIESKKTEENMNNKKFTIWMQWTITKFRIKLFGFDETIIGISPTVKLIFDMEDIMCSLDVQDIYTKFKLKIVSSSIHHYKRKTIREKWEPGIYLGTIMRNREEIPTKEKQEDFGFMSITVTKAKSGHVHHKWGAIKKQKLAELKMEQSSENYSETRYISEIIATLQPVDFIVSPKVLNSFFVVLDPLLQDFNKTKQNSKQSTNKTLCLNNSNLPLVYLDCKGIRIVILCTKLIEKYENHNICIAEIENINLTPTAENPICRNPVRPDIYQQAAQSRILNIPGSDIEDRQYQLNINSFSVNTGTWSEFKEMICRDTDLHASLHTMTENPALEWNNLEWGRMSLIPNLNLLPIIKKFNQCIVIAPAITCGKDTLICGCSVEINFVSDIEINVSLHQFRLITELLNELSIKPKVTAQLSNFSYLIHPLDSQSIDLDQYAEAAKDSGVEIFDASETTSKIKDNSSQFTELSKVHSGSRSSDISQGFKSTHKNTINQDSSCPLEILMTGGKITISLYLITNQKVIDKKKMNRKYKDTGYEASEEESVSGMPHSQKVLPLLFVLFSQPNIYVQTFVSEQKINLSCFDVIVKTGEMHAFIDKLPNQKDYPIFLMETKPGISDPVTGIPPAFLTLKWSQILKKKPVLNIDFGRPIRFHYSFSKLNHFLYIRNHINDSFKDSYTELANKFSMKSLDTANDFKNNTNDSFIKYKSLKSKFNNIGTIGLKFSQIVLNFKTEIETVMLFSLERFESNLTFLNRPERIVAVVNFKHITIGCNYDGSYKLLLSPWTGFLKISAFWESWQKYDSDPQIQITFESDCLHFNIGPEQIKCCQDVIQEINDLITTFSVPQSNHEMKNRISTNNNERDQYYKDDLRAGAFQFVDATGNEFELPLPYQVMFWNQTIVAMAWRYPQPRILSKVRVFPIPFKDNYNDSENQTILCFLEYWSECLGCYKLYTEFYLSESEVCQLDLPKNIPQSAVSCTWRVVFSFSDSKLNSNFISPRILAACMRVDSYFNPILVPQIQLAVNLLSIKFSFFNQFNKNLGLKMPGKLQNFTPDGLMPDDQCFLILHFENFNLFLAYWYSDIATIDLKTFIKCCVLDYASLTMQSLIESFSLKTTLNLAEHVYVDFLSDDFNIKFNPTIGHTLAISYQLWSQNWLTNFSTEIPDMVVVTRYVICNDTNLKIRFGQIGTDEDILLPSRFLHLYSWRSNKYQRSIKIGIEQNHWIWSNPLNIDLETTTEVSMDQKSNFSILMIVKKLSATQKQIIFSGQLVICNMLSEHFETKVIPFASENKNMDLKNAQSYIIAAKSTAPSLVVDSNKKMALRIRFLTLESAWSGDVPLEENTKCSQPWLVKIPLQERGQFLSIWCRVFTEKSDYSRRTLVLLWPLFMIRSNLPINIPLHIETPVLNVRLETNVIGRGQTQQLYCPGTIDHAHHLSFEIDNIQHGSNPYVPLNYSLVDHKDIFQKIETDDIDSILEELNDCYETDWPFYDQKLVNIEWDIAEQPLTHIQVFYRTICPSSSSLLVEVTPWCMILNTLGLPIYISIDTIDLCYIKHYGLVTPPKLENTFNIGIHMNNSVYKSPVLQLARNDWSQTFYMPKINGVIPLDGTINIPIKCDNWISMVSIKSNIVNDMRILEVSSSFIFSNHTSLKLQLICVALCDNNISCSLSKDVLNHKITVDPNSDHKNFGVSLTKWIDFNKINDCEYTFHLIISVEESDAYSIPIKLDKNIYRKNICIYSKTSNIPLVLITQEVKGILYLSVYHDLHPQFLIKNNCSKIIYFAQCEANTEIVENDCINYTCSVKPQTEIFYTMPGTSEKFPSIEVAAPDTLIIAVKPEKKREFKWSNEVNLSISGEQYTKVPSYGEVKISVKKLNYTTLVIIDSVTEVEISAKDIRSRLLNHSNEQNLSIEDAAPLNSIEEIVVIDSSKNEINLSENQVSEVNRILSDYSTSNRQKAKYISLAVVLKSLIFTLTMDDEDGNFEEIHLTTLTCDYVSLTLEKNEKIDSCISVSAIQCDNRLFHREFFDFPVVLMGKSDYVQPIVCLNSSSVRKLLSEIRMEPDILINLQLELWKDKFTQNNITEIQEMAIKINSLSIYIEDIFVTKMVDYLSILQPSQLVMWSFKQKPNFLPIKELMVEIPEQLLWEAKLLAYPLNLNSFKIEQVSLLLSVHYSIKLYIALDRSPLQFSCFERKNIQTTSYQLGHALTVHYISGAIFGAGWVVGSLELLGSPSGLARYVGTGLKDFISMPYHGLVQSPWAFLVGITHGSASLMKHITAGTLDSVTKLASSVARNLDRLTLDEEHQRRVEEHRRQKPQGLTEGLVKGLTGLGISLLGAVGGIAHHTLQSVMKDGASPRGVLEGVGLGLVGVITKPLSGAAELVACTGQGLLQGAGWNPLPVSRIYSISNFGCSLNNCIFKYKWKILLNIAMQTNIILAAEAIFNSNSVLLLVTLEGFVVINTEDDIIDRVIHYNEMHSIVKASHDFTELRINLLQNTQSSSTNVEFDAEMDKISRARVAEYIRKTAGVQLSPSEKFNFSPDFTSQSCLNFYVVPEIRNHLCDILMLAKQQTENNTFKIL